MHPEVLGVLAHALESPGDVVRQHVLYDCLLDHGATELVALEAFFRRPLTPWDVWSFGGGGIGSGIGSGIGGGIGSGIGSGIGGGRGSGIGGGRGSGSGIGSGSGSGSGSGIGSGSGSGGGSGGGSGIGSEPYQVKIMKVGQAYLIHCGDWHTFVGRVVAQLGPCTYELEKVSKIAETNNGDCWHHLAAGDAKLRKAVTYKHYETNAVIPLAIAAFVWVGKLPQEM